MESGLGSVDDKRAEYRLRRVRCQTLGTREHRVWLLPISKIAIYEQVQHPENVDAVTTAEGEVGRRDSTKNGTTLSDGKRGAPNGCPFSELPDGLAARKDEEVSAMERAEAPRHAAELPPCDLVMKGGVTSGVVYPSLAIELARTWRFASIGGASAGAIAAVVTAAAEYGRNDGGFDQHLAETRNALAKEGFLIGLFQPTKKTKPVLDLMLKLQKVTGAGRRARTVVGLALRHFPLPALASALLVAGFLGALIVAFGGRAAFGGGSPLSVQLLLGLSAPLMIIAGGLVGALAGGAWGLRRIAVRDLPQNMFGLVSGMRPEGSRDQALTEWLYERTQKCAGRGQNPDKPVTFRDLKGRKVDLRTITTDLGAGRPVILPVPEKRDQAETPGYIFSVEDFARLFPADVVRYLERVSPECRDHEGFYYLPGDDLPIIVAARLSLSFPILLSAVPLYVMDGEGALRTHWFSDGGITSNFPIHFFDSWLPNHPTFGLILTDCPDQAKAGHGKTDVQHHARMLEPNLVAAPGGGKRPGPVPLGHLPVDSVFALVGRVFDTMMNWRDTLQAELPGFRERVCQVELHREEGGMNLGMPPEVIERLIGKGQAAAGRIQDAWDNPVGWDRHRYTRYLYLMENLQTHMQRRPSITGGESGVIAAWQGPEGFKATLEAGCPGVNTYLRTPQWHAAAARETSNLLETIDAWGKMGDPDFTSGELPKPSPDMRITPKA